MGGTSHACPVFAWFWRHRDICDSQTECLCLGYQKWSEHVTNIFLSGGNKPSSSVQWSHLIEDRTNFRSLPPLTKSAISCPFPAHLRSRNTLLFGAPSRQFFAYYFAYSPGLGQSIKIIFCSLKGSVQPHSAGIFFALHAWAWPNELSAAIILFWWHFGYNGGGRKRYEVLREYEKSKETNLYP